MSLEAPRAIRGVKSRVTSRFWGFDQDGAWVVEKPYDVAFEDVGWFLDFTKLPGTINGVVPDGSLPWEASTINIVSDESVGSLEVMFTFW